MPKLVARLRRRVGHEAAEDAVQEALLRAWARQFSDDALNSLPAWISHVATNIGYDVLRRRRTERDALARWAMWTGATASTIPDLDSNELEHELEHALLQLPEPQRVALVLHYLADMPITDIALTTDTPEGTIKSNLHRGRRALGTALQGGAPMTSRPAVEYEHQPKPHLQKGWFLQGAHPTRFEHGIIGGHDHDGKRIGYVRSSTTDRDSNCTLLQVFSAEKYRGKHMRFTANLRTFDVEGWSGLWMRVNTREGSPLAFDNMLNRSLSGTNDWARHAVVLDVAEHADSIGFGVILTGFGEVWFSDFQFEAVPVEIPSTHLERSIMAEPINLDLSRDYS